MHPLPPEQDRARTVLFWRRGASSPKVAALAEILAAHGNIVDGCAAADREQAA